MVIVRYRSCCGIGIGFFRCRFVYTSALMSHWLFPFLSVFFLIGIWQFFQWRDVVRFNVIVYWKKKIVTQIWENIFVSHILFFTTGTINFNFPETASPLTISCHWSFSIPPDYIKNQGFSDVFRGVTKETSGIKWVRLFFLVLLADVVSENFKPAYTRKLRNSKHQFKNSLIFQFWLTKTNNKTWSNYTWKSWRFLAYPKVSQIHYL